MSAWTPARQVRYERAKERGTLAWKCLICNRELRSEFCPHSRSEHEQAVDECRIIHISQKGRGR